MAKNLSAVKRVQVAARNNQRNKKYKSAIKTIAKKILTEVESSGNSTANSDNGLLALLTSQAYSRIDKAVKKGVLHKNSAARKKSRLAKRIKVL